ncbi:MAG: TonB family protein [Myxococcales bacterium]|nr:TonB family protein [Myxococcales bacterium]
MDEAAKAGADDVARASTMLRDLQRGDGSALQNPWGDAGNDENPSKVWNDVPLPEPNRASAESRPGVGDPREGLGAADIGIGAGGGDRTSATVVADEPTVDGGLNEAVVRRILWHNAGLARSCYQKALEDRPGLSGRVVLELAIGPAGAVTTVTIRQGMDPEVDACVRRAMKRMQFPARDGGGVVRVGYPLVFRTAR